MPLYALLRTNNVENYSISYNRDNSQNFQKKNLYWEKYFYTFVPIYIPIFALMLQHEHLDHAWDNSMALDYIFTNFRKLVLYFNEQLGVVSH